MAQLDNAADSDSEERGFKSLRAGQKKKPVIPYVSRDCRLFSTDEGVNDFLNWLKEDSGYSKAEKESVLQRIIDFFDRIVEAVKQTIKDGDLSKTAREFAQMQADKAAQIREMFLDALDGIDGKARKNTAEETKNSKKKQRKYTNPYENWYGVDSDGHFLPSNEIGGSDASEQALFWVAQEDVTDGDLRLATGLGSCYIIERMENDRYGYKVVEKIEERDRDYEKQRITEHNREKRTDLEGRLAGYNNNNKSAANAVGDERHDSDVPEAGHQTKSRQIRSVAGTSFNQRKTRIDTEQNTFGGNENRTGNGTERLTDSEETKNSLRHSLGISDNTAEVASYYGFAAVFAALVASEAADVVDSALAAVVEFVAAALDVAVDSSAEKVPAVEDNSAKADEVSPEFSAGNDVESVDELFCVPFNLKAFRKPFTPRPK